MTAEKLFKLIKDKEIRTRVFDFSDRETVAVAVDGPNILGPDRFTIVVNRDDWDDNPTAAMTTELARLAGLGLLNFKDRELSEKPPCWLPEKDNPYPLCVGRGMPACAHCCLWVDYDTDEDEKTVNLPLGEYRLWDLIGEPVWVESKGEPAGWRVVDNALLNQLGDYGERWQAFRYSVFRDERTPLRKLQDLIDECNGGRGCGKRCTQAGQDCCEKLKAHRSRMEYSRTSGLPTTEW